MKEQGKWFLGRRHDQDEPDDPAKAVKPRKRPNGEGGVTQEDGRWRGRYSLVVDGRLVRRSVYSKTREEAVRAAPGRDEGRDDGTPLSVGRDRLADWLDPPRR